MICLASERVAALVASIVWIVSCAPGRAYAMSACTDPIAACPCAIKSAGDYTISGPGLIASPPGDCIHVNVPGVTLDLGSTTLSTPPASATSVGILVTANAVGAVVRGALDGPRRSRGSAPGSKSMPLG